MNLSTIIFLFLFINVNAQNPHFPKVKISVPCTYEFVNNYKGKWLIHDPSFSPISVNDYHAEATNRLNQIQNLVHDLYPEPTGCDASWIGEFNKTSFADEVKYVSVEGEWKQQPVKTNPVYSLSYNLVLCSWLCHGTNEIMNGYPEIGGASLTVNANWLEILNENFLEGNEGKI